MSSCGNCHLISHRPKTPQADAYLYGTLSLFGGMLFYKGLDCVVHLLEGTAGHHDVNLDLYDLDEVSPGGGTSAKGDKTRGWTIADEVSRSQTNSQTFPREHDVVVELSSGSAIQPSPDLHTLQLRLAGRVQSPQQQYKPENKSTASGDLSASEESEGGDEGAGDADGNAKGVTDVEEHGTPQTQVQDKELVRMGMMTALAIGIHNFPEGLATFVATLSNPAVGASLAVAIAIHNIPEGLCVAIPVYYATGNRWKAFGWAFLSGISEPIGAGLGWLILKDKMTDLVYGILFGMVAGMMVIITLQELIPTAVRYDPADKVTTNSIIFGMAVMALSLILFLY